MFYSSSIESEMKKLYNSLSEKDKRRYAASEEKKMGWGGISYMMQRVGCSRNTIVQEIKDLEKIDEMTIDKLRVRKKNEEEKVFHLRESELMKPFYKI